MRKILIAIFLSLLSFPAWAVNYCNDSNTAAGWELDDTSWQDCTINGNSGTTVGVLDVVAAKYDNGVRFTGDNNTYINFGSGATIDNVFDGGGTFALWAAIDDPGTAGTICSGGTIASKGPANGWELCVNIDGSLTFGYKFEFGYNIWTTTTTPFSAFDFTAKHIMVYYNSDSADNDPIIGVDCSAQSITQTATNSGTRNTDAGWSLTFSVENDLLEIGEIFGIFDDAILYNGDLTADCATLAANGIDGSHGSGGSSDIATGKIINGAILNDIVF